eukprot:14516971-Ditylum_brightwellii.AAC.1
MLEVVTFSGLQFNWQYQKILILIVITKVESRLENTFLPSPSFLFGWRNQSFTLLFLVIVKCEFQIISLTAELLPIDMVNGDFCHFHLERFGPLVTQQATLSNH